MNIAIGCILEEHDLAGVLQNWIKSTFVDNCKVEILKEEFRKDRSYVKERLAENIESGALRDF